MSLKMMQTNPTTYTDINELLEVLLMSMQKILGEKLVGLYLYGSLVIGDFDPTISDIDLVAAPVSKYAVPLSRSAELSWLFALSLLIGVSILTESH